MLIREFVSLSIFLAVVLAVYVKEVFFIGRFILSKLRHKNGASGLTTKPAIAIHALALVGILCFLYGVFIEPYWIEVKRVELSTDKLKHAELRIVQISDLHEEPNAGNKEKIVGIVNSLKPDVIVFTGDTVNTPEALPVFKSVLKSMNASIGKFAVTGNFDYWFLRGLNFFGGTGFRNLDVKSVKLEKDGEEFYLSGVNFGQQGRWREALSGIPAGYYNIFLYHKPDLIEEVKDSGIDLYLCGHTHGGQVALPFYGAVITFAKYGKRYEAGEYKVGNTVLYVNRGIGMEGKAGLRIRFFARPEITVFDIKPKGRI